MISLSRNHAEAGTGNILWTTRSTTCSTHIDICLVICHVTLKIYVHLHRPCSYRILSSEKVVDVEALNEASNYLQDGIFI